MRIVVMLSNKKLSKCLYYIHMLLLLSARLLIISFTARFCSIHVLLCHQLFWVTRCKWKVRVCVSVAKQFELEATPFYSLLNRIDMLCVEFLFCDIFALFTFSFVNDGKRNLIIYLKVHLSIDFIMTRRTS